eukprot:SAG31_NODE_11095_length_1066_cov_1.759049_1_plen_21_part_01
MPGLPLGKVRPFSFVGIYREA